MKDIKNYYTFTKIKPINKGWSTDKKYYVETKNGERLLLRISDISEYEDKKSEFNIMKKIATVGINMSIPIDFGVCNNGKSVYQIAIHLHQIGQKFIEKKLKSISKWC